MFDILELDGRDLRGEPLKRRKEILRKLLHGAPDAIRYSEDVAGHGDKVLAQACRSASKASSPSRPTSRTCRAARSSWLKIKCLGNEEFVIGGYRVSDKKGRPFASLLLGEFEGGKLHYRGRVGTGFDTAMLDDLGAQFAKLRAGNQPLSSMHRAPSARDAHWVEPKLVAQIAFTERTTDGLLRHPAFLGLRGDKPAREVQTQTVTTVAKKATSKLERRR